MNIKRNFLIAIMILCAGFVSAQSTVRGFTAGGSTGKAGDANPSETYVVFGQQFGLMGMDDAENFEASEGLAQMQLTTDTVEVVVSYGDGYYLQLGNTTFTLSADSITKEVAKHPRHAYFDAYFINGAQYKYDSALVLHIYQCDSSVVDVDGNEYGIVAMNNECWTTENLRAKHYCDGDPVDAKGEWYIHNVGQSGALVDPAGMEYVSPQGEEIPKNMGLLYTWQAASGGVSCLETFETPYLQGVCPCGWHLPTPEEMQYLRTQATQTLRADDPSWVNGSGNNYTRFSALPAGYYNSTNQRFEGYHTEADFWGVADCGNETEPATPTYLQIAYFCDYTLQQTRIPEDGLSVRCVFPILDYENPNPKEVCPKFGTLTETEDQLGFSCPVKGDYEGATVTLQYNAGIDYTIGNNEPGTTGYAVDDGNVSLTIENGQVSWHYELPSGATADMVSLGITLILEKGDCRNVLVKTLKDVTPPTTECVLYVDVQPVSAMSMRGTVSGTLENITESTVTVTSKTYVGVDQSVGINETYELTVNQEDGTFSWTYEPENVGDQIGSIEGYVTIIGNTPTCIAEQNFNTAPEEELICPVLADVELNIVENDTLGMKCQIEDFNADYIDGNITCVTFKYIYPGDTVTLTSCDDNEVDVNISETGLITANYPEPVDNYVLKVIASVRLYYNTEATSGKCGLDNYTENTIYNNQPTCPTIGDVQFLGDQGYYFKVNDLDFEKISDITIDYTAVFTDIDDPEHTATITGTDYYDGGNGTIYYDSDQEYPFGWFFSSDEMPQFEFDLPTIYTTLTIVYDGQICEGSVSEYIEVQEPDFIDCPGLSQIITNPNYGYETTITQYDENAGEFRVEYHVYLAGETEPEMVIEDNDNLIFDPDDANGSMNISGHLPSNIWGQFDKEITKIEVFLFYEPSVPYSSQCDDDDVSATLYTAQTVDDGCPRIGTLASNAPYKLTINVDNYNGNRIDYIYLNAIIYGVDDEELGSVQQNLPVHQFTNGTYTWYVGQDDIGGLTLDNVTHVVGSVQLVPKSSTDCNTEDPKQFDTLDLQD